MSLLRQSVFKCFLVILCLSILSCEEEDPIEEDTQQGVAADFTLDWTTLIGTSEGEDVAGMVMDASGNIFVVLSEEPDGYDGDVVVMKVSNDGATVLWAKKLDLGDQDFFPSPSENGHANGGGGSRCIDIDASGDVYIAGATKSGFYDVFVVKLSGTDGTIQWQTIWENDNSGLAKSEAKAYALDESNGSVFVTGGSAGGTSGSGGAMLFLLNLDGSTGAVQAETKRGIDSTPGSNDRATTVFSPDGSTVYLAGWEGDDNEGLLMKFSNGGADFEWYEEISISYGSRFNDIAVDADENLYLATDFRGVSTYVGVLCLDSSGAYQWGKKYQGASNDRNNVHSIRLINDTVYVGGRVSYADWDESLYGDGLLLKMTKDGELTDQYHFYTGFEGHLSGERIEAILTDGTSIYIGGETWPEFNGVSGSWFMNSGNLSDYNPSISKYTSVTIEEDDGYVNASTFTESTFSPTVRQPSEGGIGSADVMIWKITEN